MMNYEDSTLHSVYCSEHLRTKDSIKVNTRRAGMHHEMSTPAYLDLIFLTLSAIYSTLVPFQPGTLWKGEKKKPKQTLDAKREITRTSVTKSPPQRPPPELEASALDPPESVSWPAGAMSSSTCPMGWSYGTLPVSPKRYPHRLLRTPEANSQVARAPALMKIQETALRSLPKRRLSLVPHHPKQGTC